MSEASAENRSLAARPRAPPARERGASLGAVALVALFVVGSLGPPVALTVSAASSAVAASGPSGPTPALGAGATASADDSTGLANCSQGSHAVYQPAVSGDAEPILLADYTALGALGGGTVYLAAGTFVLDETLTLEKFGDVTFQGQGPGATILAMPKDPVGKFTNDAGRALGRYNLSKNEAVGGVTANLIQISGPTPLDDLAFCDLGLNARATDPAEDWSGSLLFDSSGGTHHVYRDLAEIDLFGPSTEPNGLHLDRGADGGGASGYVLDGLNATDDAVPYETYAGYRSGANFLNIGGLQNSTLENVVGQGQAAFEVAPAVNCTVSHWNVTGHLTIDPATGGSWGGTVFEEIDASVGGTPSSYVLTTQVAGASSGKGSNFSALRWVHDTFRGTVLNGENMVAVYDTLVVGRLNETPAVLESSEVTWTGHAGLPVLVSGGPTGGKRAVFRNDTFVFEAGTNGENPFRLTVANANWSQVTIEIRGSTSSFVFEAPGVRLARASSFTGMVYLALGAKDPTRLKLIDNAESTDFTNLGASVSGLVHIGNNLPTTK